MKHVKKSLATAILLSACSGKNTNDNNFVGQWGLVSQTCATGAEVKGDGKLSDLNYTFDNEGQVTTINYIAQGTANAEIATAKLKYHVDGDVLVLEGEESMKFAAIFSEDKKIVTLTQLDHLDSDDNPCPRGLATVVAIKKISSAPAAGQTQNASGMQGMGAAKGSVGASQLSDAEAEELRFLSPEMIKEYTSEMNPAEKAEFMRLLNEAQSRGASGSIGQGQALPAAPLKAPGDMGQMTDEQRKLLESFQNGSNADFNDLLKLMPKNQ